MTINYGIIAYIPHPEDKEKVSILHFAGYETEPEKVDFEELYGELKTDPEFNLQDVDFDLTLAPDHIVELFKKQYENEQNDGEQP